MNILIVLDSNCLDSFALSEHIVKGIQTIPNIKVQIKSFSLLNTKKKNSFIDILKAKDLQLADAIIFGLPKSFEKPSLEKNLFLEKMKYFLKIKFLNQKIISIFTCFEYEKQESSLSSFYSSILNNNTMFVGLPYYLNKQPYLHPSYIVCNLMDQNFQHAIFLGKRIAEIALKFNKL